MPDTPDGAVQRRDAGAVTILRINAAMLRGDPFSDELFAQLEDAVERSGRRKFVLDVGAVQYVASAAMGKLVGLNRKARAAAATLAVCNVTPSVARVLEVTRLRDVLLTYASEEEAVTALS
jgi:anti-sigma B factor antagonist